MPIDSCRIIELLKFTDVRGSLTFIESGRHAPFELKRVYYLYDVPGDAERGGHGHKNLQQLIIALAGSFDVELTDGTNRKVYSMNRPNQGLYVAPMMWRDIRNFSSGAVCMVLASDNYTEDDYFRSYESFLCAVRG